MRVLLAEDNELNMEIAETFLTDAGVQITKAYNGKRRGGALFWSSRQVPLMRS